MGESTDTAGTLQTFKAVADNPLTRNVLKALSRHCPKDKGNRLEVALELYVGARKEACFSCRLSRNLLSPILAAACRGFGLTQEQLKNKFQDAYWRRGLDWSQMKRTFTNLPQLKQQKILEKGYWSKSKGRFEEKAK